LMDQSKANKISHEHGKIRKITVRHGKLRLFFK